MTINANVLTWKNLLPSSKMKIQNIVKLGWSDTNIAMQIKLSSYFLMFF